MAMVSERKLRLLKARQERREQAEQRKREALPTSLPVVAGLPVGQCVSCGMNTEDEWILPRKRFGLPKEMFLCQSCLKLPEDELADRLWHIQRER